MSQALSMYAPQPFYDLDINLTPARTDMVPLPNIPTLEQIRQLEDLLWQGPTLDVDEITTHHFSEGLYGREIRIPAGTILTGKMHRQGQINVLAQGDITVWTEQGMKRLQAPAVIVSGPGCKRVGYAHSDVVWITVLASEETDLVRLEQQLIEPEPVRQIAGTRSITKEWT